MSVESFGEPNFFEGIVPPFNILELAGFERVANELLASNIYRISIQALDEELTTSLKCAKIMGVEFRGPDHPLI